MPADDREEIVGIRGAALARSRTVRANWKWAPSISAHHELTGRFRQVLAAAGCLPAGRNGTADARLRAMTRRGAGSNELTQELERRRRSEVVPREQWGSFLGGFSRAHEGWLATLEVSERGSRKCVLVHESPLRGISVDGRRITISFGTNGETRLTHAVETPESMVLSLEDVHTERAIQIVSSEEVTELRFRSAMPTEVVDGMP